jgi:ParB family chromosome partitioning protein
MAAELQPVKVMDIREGDRYRKEMGDIDALAESIRTLGLLQPPVIVKDTTTAVPSWRLVAGARRLAAVRKLGWSSVQAVVVDNLHDALAFLRAERDENICRKDFTPSEAVAIGKALEELERAQARERQAQAGPAEGKGRKTTGSGKLPEAVAGRTRDKVAEAVGLSGRTYEKAKKVVEAAEADPAAAPLVEEMDRTGKVDPAYQRVAGKSPSRGAERQLARAERGLLRAAHDFGKAVMKYQAVPYCSEDRRWQRLRDAVDDARVRLAEQAKCYFEANTGQTLKTLFEQ